MHTNVSNENLKLIFIIFYFGPFPAYSDFFFASCAKNPDITWLIYTDQERSKQVPANVIFRRMRFSECRRVFQNTFSPDIALDSPKKLCDFKPSYGYVLQDEIRGYDYWGYCDMDMIFGRIMDFLPENLSSYDKFGSLGHFTLFRNTERINRVFLDGDTALRRWHEVSESSKIFAFDEWGINTINDLFENPEFSFCEDGFVADVWPGSTPFYLSRYQKDQRRYAPVDQTAGIFHYRDGQLFYIRSQTDRKEVPCAHFQKRIFQYDRSAVSADDYYILPDRIVSGSQMSLEEALALGTNQPLLDLQWLKLKKISIDNRLRHRRAQ